MRSLTWLDENAIKKLPPLRGVVAEAGFPANILGGWIFPPYSELTHVQLYLNGKSLAFVPLWERTDVGDIYPRFPQALRSGYQINLPSGLLRKDDVNRVTAVGYHADKAVGFKRGLMFDDSFPPDVPIPPLDLRKRTQGDPDVAQYKRLGYRFYREALDAITPHRDPRSFRKILDWGCGTGRVTANLLTGNYGFEVHACDPHPASIAWCQENVPGARWAVSPWKPPLAYPKASFDFVLGLGVVYNFSREEMEAWLEELERILVPGGILLFSIQGAFAAAVRFSPDGLTKLQREGFLNSVEYDAQFPPVPDERLYRGGYYWTPGCVQDMVKRHFRVLDYLEGVFTGDQDLVVLERTG